MSDPDTLRAILDVAFTRNASRPTSIHVTTATYHRICSERGCDPTKSLFWQIRVTHAIPVEGMDVVVDDTIPAFPGFEVHRKY